MPQAFWDWFGKLSWPWKVLIVLLTWWIVIPLYAWTRSSWPNWVKWIVTAMTTLLFITVATAQIAQPPAKQVSSPASKKKGPAIRRKPSQKTTYETLETTGTIPFQEEHVQDPNLPKGQSVVRQEGLNGVNTFVYRIKMVDGVETTRTLQIADGTMEPPPPAAPAAAPAAPSSPTVYVTNTGKRYHQAHPDGCHSYLSQSKIPISLSDAIAQGYTPCQCASCSW